MVHHTTKLIDILTNYCVYNIKRVVNNYCISYVYLPEVDPGMDATDLLRHAFFFISIVHPYLQQMLLCVQILIIIVRQYK